MATFLVNEGTKRQNFGIASAASVAFAQRLGPGRVRRLANFVPQRRDIGRKTLAQARNIILVIEIERGLDYVVETSMPGQASRSVTDNCGLCAVKCTSSRATSSASPWARGSLS